MTPSHPVRDADLVRLIDDQGTAEERARLLEHVESCPGCAERMRALAALSERVDHALHLAAPDPTDFGPWRLSDAPRGRPGRRVARWRRRLGAGLAAAACVALLLIPMRAYLSGSLGLRGPDADREADASAALPDAARSTLTLAPVGPEFRLLVASPQERGALVVGRAEGSVAQASVTGSNGAARLKALSDGLEIANIGELAASYVVRVPATVERLSLKWATLLDTLLWSAASPPGAYRIALFPGPAPGAPTGVVFEPAEPQPSKFRWFQVADGVFVVVPDGMGSSSLVVLGSEGVLLVDTQIAPAAAELFLDELSTRTAAPVRWVVNTHWHLDHSNGNDAVAGRHPEARFFSHASAPAAAAALGEEQRARILDFWGAEGGPRRPVDETSLRELRAPFRLRADVQLARDTVLDLGGRSVTLLAMGGGHSAGDLVVYLDEAGVLAAGDLALPTLFATRGDPAGHVAALDRMLALQPDFVVGGHGDIPFDLGALAEQRDQLAALVDAVHALLESGSASGEDFASLVGQAGPLLADPEGLVRTTVQRASGGGGGGPEPNDPPGELP